MKGMFFAFAMFILSIFPASAQTIHPQSANSPKGGTVRGILFPKSSTTPDCPYDWRKPSIFYKQLDTNKFPIRLQSFFILYDGLTKDDGHYVVGYGQGYQFLNVDTGNPCKVSSDGSANVFRGVAALLTANGIAIEHWKGPEANNAEVWFSPKSLSQNTKELPPGGYWLRLSIEPTAFNTRTATVSVELLDQSSKKLDSFSRLFLIQDIFPSDDYISAIIGQAQMNKNTEFYAFDYF